MGIEGQKKEEKKKRKWNFGEKRVLIPFSFFLLVFRLVYAFAFAAKGRLVFILYSHLKMKVK